MNNRLHLFAHGIRTDSRPGSHTEATFAFLDRCAWPSCAAIRQELEGWFANYPAAKQKEIRRRLVADDFSAAFFELFLHELLRRSNCAPEVEPEIQSGQRPDFRAFLNTERFYLEAAVVEGVSSQDRGKKAVLAVLYDAINEIDSPDYFLDVLVCDPKGSLLPSSRAIRSFLSQNIARTNHSELLGLEWESFPTWLFEDEKVRIAVRPIPKHEARGLEGIRPIGFYPMESRWGGAERPIRTRLLEKAKSYKNLDGPFVIAINALAWARSRDDMVAALFGSEQLIVDFETKQLRPSRQKNGLFYGGSGPRYTRVSAVLSTTVLPWTVAKCSVELFVNPWAAQPLTISDFPATITRVVGGRLFTEPGPAVSGLFGLAPDWPELTNAPMPDTPVAAD